MAAEPTAPTEVGSSPESSVVLEVPLGFALSFISGRGLLTTRDRRLGPVELKTLELEIPRIAFPFDVTGGAERFKTHRCLLRHLVFGVDADGLSNLLRRTDLVRHGFVELKAAFRDGFVELTGRFAVGEHQADFTFRAALLVRSPEELNVVFFDARVYGWLPVPAALLPEFLRRALALSFFAGGRAGAWTVRPIERFLRETMPRNGWKVPDLSHANLVAAEVARGQLVIVAGPEGEPTPRQILEREAPAAAVRAGEGVATYSRAEEALGRGDIQTAYELFRETTDDERGGPWARERLLQIGAADPELALETRQLAEEVLARDAEDIQALLALAAIAMRERSWGEATNRYEALAEIARKRREGFDAVAAELAAAGAATPIDPAGALAAYERAAARARDSLTAHRALFDLRRAAGDWQGAALTGERLVKLESELGRRAGVHRDLGHVYRAQLGDLKRARLHFERALRLAPDDPGSLEGLAETYAARGEPARAASYLARLAEQAEASQDQSRIVALNLRLGEIWERWLGDLESAAGRYYRVLDADPRNRTARLRLAKLAEDRGEVARARTLYEDLLAVEEERGDPEAIPDLVAAYTRLARVTLTVEGPTAEAIACLERAVELDPRNRAARDELARVLRERGEWSRLIHLLEETAKVAATPEEVRRSRIAAAQLELHQRDDRRAARRLLEEVLAERADDAEALELLIPMLESEGDLVELIDRLVAAADVTTEPVRRADYLYRLAMAREAMGIAAEERARDLGRALDANPYLRRAAERLVTLAEAQQDPPRLARALERLAVAADDPATRADAWLRRGVLLWRELGREEEALVTIRESVRVNPNNLTAWTALSRLAEKQGDLDTARQALEQALLQAAKSGGNRAPLHERLAELARQADDTAAEAHHLREAFAAGLRSDALAERLVLVLSKQGKRELAAQLLEEWAAQGEDGGLWLQAAEVRRSLGNFDRATGILRQVIALGHEEALAAAFALEKLAGERHDHAAVAEALQVQLAAAAEPNVELLERLLAAQLQLGEPGGIEITCQQLLELDPFIVSAHQALAHLAEERGAFSDALSHYWTLVRESPKDRLDRPARRRVFERAAGIMHELAPEKLAALRAAFDEEFPEAPPDALARPLGQLLDAEQAWTTALALREEQLRLAAPAEAVGHRRQIAELLHRRLGRGEEAIPYYQDVIASQPHDIAAREALVEVFTALGRWGDLGSLLFAMSHLVNEPVQVLDYGLRSVEIYADRVGDPTAASDVLRALVGMAGAHADERLSAALRRHAMWSELAVYLEKQVEAEPDPDDPRFAELIEVVSARLEDPNWAAAWCGRMVEAFPTSDTAWHQYLTLLAQHPAAGDEAAVLRAWADARDGAARAQVLQQLGEWHHRHGDEPAALAALAEAAEADQDNVALLDQLVERHTGRGDWAAVRRWLERLAFASEPGPEREARLRRLVGVATDYAEDAAVAARGLRALEQRSEDETRLLAHLYAQSGDIDGLEQLEGSLEAFDREAALHASRGLLAKGRLDTARRFLARALELGATVEAWDLAAVAWREAGRLGELGRWRLEYADRAPPEERRWLRLLGRAELIEAGEESAATGAALESELAGADLEQTADAWAVFCVARGIKQHDWADRAAAALRSKLAEGDLRLAPVLRHQAERAVEGQDWDEAARLASRLQTLGDPDGEGILETVLVATDRTSELIDLLQRRAERGGADASATWARLAELQAGLERWTEVSACLDRVADGDKDLRWAELNHRAGEALDDGERIAAAAAQAAARAPDTLTKASWLRRQASALWWRLEREAEARELLGEAHLLAPDDAEAVQSSAELDLEQGDRQGAWRTVAEGLAVLDGPEAGPLWVLRAELLAVEENLPQTIDALVRASELLGEVPSAWRRLGDLALRLGEQDLALPALARAFALDPEHEEAYTGALEQAGRWSELLAVLEQRAEKLSGAEEGERLARAARIAHTRLGEPEKALRLIQQATRHVPTVENMQLTFALAHQLDRPTVIAAIAPPLLKRLPEDADERPEVLHALCAALEHLGLGHEAGPALAELRRRNLATPAEKRLLADAVMLDDPADAATLVEEAARAEPGEALLTGLLAAAKLWLAAKDEPTARGLLHEALAEGLDSVEAHQLALRLFAGDERGASLLRLLALGGDAELEPAARAALRLEAATLRLSQKDPAGAWALLSEARELGPPDGWLAVAEQALRALEQPLELAAFWLREIEAGAWSEAEQIERLREAVEIYRRADDLLAGLRALQALGRLLPDDEEIQDQLVEAAAQLGDQDQFLAHVERELGGAEMPDQRAALVLRYAPVLVERFNDAAAAVKLLSPAYAEVPSTPLCLVLADALQAAGQVPRAIDLLDRRAAEVDGAERLPLLARAARLARDQVGDPARAFELFRQVFALAPADGEARDFCLDYALEQAEWAEAVGILERAAAVAGDASTAYAQLMRAADLARDQLANSERELVLLRQAVEALPTDQVAVTRLLERQVAGDDTDGALGLMLGGHVLDERELELGRRLLALLDDGGRDQDGDELREYLAARHPESEIGRRVRLARARAAGDAAASRVEIEGLLAGELSDDERLLLLAEAARACATLGESSAALAHARAALAAPSTDVELLLLAHRLTDTLGDAEAAALVVQKAAGSRRAIAERAETAEPDERLALLVLLGRAHEAAGAPDEALAAFETAAAAAERLPAPLGEQLGRLYERRGDWPRLVRLLNRQVTEADDELVRAELYYRMGEIWLRNLVDEERAGDCFALCLRSNPEHAAAQLAYGLMLYRRNQFAEALPLLSAQVDLADPASGGEPAEALFDCLRQLGRVDEALAAAAQLLVREPDRHELYATRAEMLEAAGRKAEAEQEWLAFVAATEATAPPANTTAVRRRLAALALERNDLHAAVTQLELAHRQQPDLLELVIELRNLYERTSRWAEACDLRLREAAAAPDAERRAGHYKALAATYMMRLNAPDRAAAMLERAIEATPDDIVLLKQLLALHEERNDWRQFLVVGERLLAMGDAAAVDGAFYAKIARAYHEAADDNERAKEFFQRAITASPDDAGLLQSFAEFARRIGDLPTFVQVEELAVARLEDADEQVGRYQELADLCLHQLRDLGKAAGLLFRARELRPDDVELLRSLANIYALDQRSYAQAIELYRELVNLRPLDTQTLRILARLSGQLGDNDRAYGFYAALSALLPGDDEARRFVDACRPAVPPGPQRALGDADRVLGLIHPDQPGPVEDLFAPLARFAELTRPGDLGAAGVSDRDQLPPTDSRVQYLRRVLEPLGLPKVALYLWRGGGFAVRTELLGTPAILIGSTLATDASDRQRAFLVARAAELYRTGHTLCEKLTAPDLAGVSAALCLAVDPSLNPPGSTGETPVWANTIAAPMTDAIRKSLKPRVDAFLARAAEVDINRWRWAAQFSAARVAMLLCCDVEDAINAILRLRGMDDLTDDQRLAVIQESPEALDLLRFATSDAFFKLRQALGLALRPAK